MPVFSGDNALISNLEMQSDLTSSQQFLMNLRQSLFDISRTVDITSLSDKLGALTNFGLRVLFLDAMAKIGTKQEIYGEALTEINHRLLVIGEIDPVDGGEQLHAKRRLESFDQTRDALESLASFRALRESRACILDSPRYELEGLIGLVTTGSVAGHVVALDRVQHVAKVLGVRSVRSLRQPQP